MRSYLCCNASRKSSVSSASKTNRKTTTLLANIKTDRQQTKSTTKMSVPDIDNQIQWHEGECSNRDETVMIKWKVPTRYQNLSYISHGAYGAVMRATDTKTNQTVAIKRMFRPFETVDHAKRTFRELRLLQYLNHPDAQVIQLYNVFTPEESRCDFQTLYFVLNFVDFDLEKVIQRKVPFSEDHIRQIIYSILRGLKFIHSAQIIHRDIKPANIGISKNSDVTILDFGLARVASNGLKTGYVATRWWRAPEVFVSWEKYNDKLDMWSVGCVMAELCRLKPLFPGREYLDQLSRIIHVIGTPTDKELEELCQEKARQHIKEELSPIPPADFAKLFPSLSPDGIDFLKKLLLFDHRIRPSAEEALKHPFLAKYREAATEPTTQPIQDIHKDAKYTIEQWKSLTWQLIENFDEPEWAQEIVPLVPQNTSNLS